MDPDKSEKESASNSIFINDLDSSKIRELLLKLVSNEEIFSSLLDLNMKFINNTTMEFENQIYNRIEVRMLLAHI